MNYFSNHASKTSIFAALTVILAGLLTGCGTAPATPQPRPTPADVNVAVVPPSTPTTAPSPTAPPAVMALDDGCVTCHTAADRLKAAATTEPEVAPIEGWAADAALTPIEASEKVLVNSKTFTKTIHGQMGCVACHGGNGAAQDKAQAHAQMQREPLAETCTQCHTDTHNQANSLHATLRGFETALKQRASQDTLPTIMKDAFGNHCQSCHTGCGQCHVSRPTNLGGGLLAGHQFKKVPPMDLTCAGCHGSRIINEFTGKNQGMPADVHWNPGGMACVECHTANELHGNPEGKTDHRYDGPPAPACLNCHQEALENAKISQHRKVHIQNIACQVCHAADYQNCYGCHLQKEANGATSFKIEPVTLGFKIGKNPNPTTDHPWKWVPVRHAPVAPDTFSFYGDNLLPNFNARPTWLYATPHTIQRNTPRTEKCDNCHGNEDAFLTEKDLRPDEIEANKNVVVAQDEIPRTRRR